MTKTIMNKLLCVLLASLSVSSCSSAGDLHTALVANGSKCAPVGGDPSMVDTNPNAWIQWQNPTGQCIHIQRIEMHAFLYPNTPAGSYVEYNVQTRLDPPGPSANANYVIGLQYADSRQNRFWKDSVDFGSNCFTVPPGGTIYSFVNGTSWVSEGWYIYLVEIFYTVD